MPKFPFLRVLLPIAAVGAVAVLTVVPASAASLPGTSIADNCSPYKTIGPANQQLINYYSCKDGSTVKLMNYQANNGEPFGYQEFRDAGGNLIESRFNRTPAADPSTVIPLADSVAP